MKVIQFDGAYTIITDEGSQISRIGQASDNADVQEWVAEGNTVEIYQEPERTYAELRAAEYPSIQDQLDMIYHDAVGWTSVWRQTIEAVKAKYPKPEE